MNDNTKYKYINNSRVLLFFSSSFAWHWSQIVYSSRPNFILQISFLQLLDRDLFAFLWYIQRNSRASGRMHAYYHHSRGGKPASEENSSKENCEFSFLEFANFLYRCWDSLLTKLSLTKMLFLLLTKLSLTKLLLTKMLLTKLLLTKFTLPKIRPSSR